MKQIKKTHKKHPKYTPPPRHIVEMVRALGIVLKNMASYSCIRPIFVTSGTLYTQWEGPGDEANSGGTILCAECW